jgi:SAM-dependent methyltransferase
MTLTTEQIHTALGDMYRVFAELPIEAQEWFLHQTCGLMEKRNNTSLYSYASFKWMREMASAYGFPVENRSILEIGAGKPLGMGLFWNLAGAKKYTSIDKFVPVNLDELWLARFQWIMNMNLFLPGNFALGDVVRKNGNGFSLNRDRLDLIQGVFETHPFSLESFDFIYSFAVLEHVTDIESILKKMYTILHRDGIMIHMIDLREHHTHLRVVPDKNTSVDFLKYSKAEWEGIYPPGSEHYINRLRASDFERCFHACGFKIVDFTILQRMNLTESVYSEIHPEFHRHPLDDLSKINIRAVLKKH